MKTETRKKTLRGLFRKYIQDLLSSYRNQNEFILNEKLLVRHTKFKNKIIIEIF